MKDWIETSAEVDNATASATRAADSVETHYVTGVDASYSDPASGLLTIKDGATVVWRGHVHDARELQFSQALRATEGNAVSAELAGAGTAGIMGVVSLQGYSL